MIDKNCDIEREIEERERERKFILDSISEFVAFYGEDKKIKWLNKTISKGTHGSPDGLVGKSLYEIWYSENRLCDDYPVSRAWESGKYEEGEVTTGGGRIWHSAANPIYEKEKMIGILEVARDITEEKNAKEAPKLELKMKNALSEEQLQKSEEIYWKLTETFPDPVTVTDIEGHITHVSQEALELHGFECADELVGRSAFELIAPEDHERAMANLEKTLKDGSVRHVEYTLLKKDQSRFIGELNAALIKDTDGNPRALIATVRDITRRKQAEKEKDKILHNLNERVKELSFFYSIDEFIRKNMSTEEILEKIVYVIPKSWQYPEITESCITYRNKEYKTNNFKETEWMQKADIPVDNEKVGIVEVCYLEERPTEDGGPFLKEEWKLITAIAERLGEIIEHRKAEEQMQESEKRFRSLFETAPSVIVLLSPDHRILEFNPEAERIYGLKREDILGKDYFELFLPENIQNAVAADMENVLKGKPTRSFENVVITHDGSEHLLTWNVNCLFDSENRSTGIIAVGLDITERKKAEEALQASEEKYRDLVENLNDVIYAVNTDGVVTYVSPSIEMFLEYKPSEVIGHHFREFFYQEDLSYLTKNFQNILLGHDAANEYRVMTKSGDMRWMRTSSRPVFTGTRVTGVQGVLSDVTDRKKAEEQIRTLSSAVEQSTDGIAIGSMGSILTYVNETFAQMHGYSPEEMVGMTIAHLHNREQMDEYKSKISTVKTEGSWMGEIGHIRKDGTPFPALVALTLLRDDKGNPTGILEVIRDITDRKKAEEQIKASLKEKEVLLREIHHRVKNNLQVVSSLLSLQSNTLTDDNMREVFNESQNRIRSMALVHENLYQGENLANIDFRKYIEALASGLLQSYGGDANKVTLSIIIDDISLGIDIAIPCGLIINELVANSLKHAFPHGRKGEIKIELHSVDNTFELIVSDNGRGIPENIDFKNTESLGLMLVTILAEDQLDGEITLEREGGTTFHVTWSS